MHLSRDLTHKATLVFFLLLGTILISINIYGLFKQLSPSEFSQSDLRFTRDTELSYEDSLLLLEKKSNESDSEYSLRATDIISKRLSHIFWGKYDSEKYNQLIPIWENYFLYFMGKYSGIPEYERYHFANYKRSLKRGIGICGDASMTLSQTLEKQGIQNKIASFPGHVVTAVQYNDGTHAVLDADFGVSMPFSIEEINKTPSLVDSYYLEKDYPIRQINSLKDSYKEEYKLWNGVEHFITKKYYFEKISYLLKWPLPLLLIIIPLWRLSKATNTLAP